MQWLVIDIHCLFLRFISRLTKIKFLIARLIANKNFSRPAAVVFFMKLFKTNNLETVTYCRTQFNFDLKIKKINQSTCIAPCMVQTTLKRSGMDHTAFNLQITPCLPLPRKRSPDGASTECGGELDKVTAVPFFFGTRCSDGH